VIQTIEILNGRRAPFCSIFSVAPAGFNDHLHGCILFFIWQIRFLANFFLRAEESLLSHFLVPLPPMMLSTLEPLLFPSPPVASADAATRMMASKRVASPTSNGVAATRSPSMPLNNSHHSILECDYDANPTYLYQAVEARQWDHARKVLAGRDARTQCATWVIRKERDGRLRWRLLPIHACIIFQAPLDVLEKMLQEYPAAAQCKDDQGE
jgi:hypothetical protein